MRSHQKIFFIQEHLQEKVFHGSIGYVDAEKTLLRNEATPVFFPYHYDFSFKAKCGRLLHLLKLFFTMPAGSILIFQYPLYARMNRFLLRLLRYRKNIRPICFICDINGLKQADQVLLQQEIAFFQRYRYFIVHNEAMRQWLRTNVPHAQSAAIQFFDFLTTPFAGERQPSMQVAFAGNLSKSPFLERLPMQEYPELIINVYGPDVTEAMKTAPGIVYKGIYEPYALPSMIEGSFGLVWDGEGATTIAGSLGNYMQYITHHKVSLYILSGLPLIIYEQAGAAALVKQYRIGITISDLNDLGRTIAAVSPAAYREMCVNTKALAKKIAAGECLTKALQEILATIEQDQ